jgi:hypothetical protein
MINLYDILGKTHYRDGEQISKREFEGDDVLYLMVAQLNTSAKSHRALSLSLTHTHRVRFTICKLKNKI